MREKHRNSANRFVFILIIICYILLNLFSPKVFRNPYLILLDVILLVVSFLGFALLFAKYMIVDTNPNHWQIFRLFITRLFGFRVPVLHFRKDIDKVPLNFPRFSRFIVLNVERGLVVAVWFDSKLKYLRYGIHLISKANIPVFYISTDLQNINLGPRSENPFSAFNGNFETKSSYLQRLEHRHETQGFTSDGIEIVPNIELVYEIQPRSPTIRIEKPDELKIEIPNLTPIIVKTVSDCITSLWRLEISRYPLKNVYYEKNEPPVLERVESTIKARMIVPGLPAEYHAFQKLIDLKLTSLCIQNLRIQPIVERSLIQDWVKTSISQLKQDNRHAARQVEFLETQFRRKKAMQFAAQISQTFSLPESPGNDLTVVVNSLVNATIKVMKPHLEKQARSLVTEIETIQNPSGLMDENSS